MFRELAEFTGKSKTISLPDAITIDGVVTSDSSIIVTGCANHFFPESYPSTNAHLETENTVKTALSRPAEAYIPPISDWEFEAAISSLKPKSSAGVDGIPATLLLLSVPLIKTQLLLILNACLLLCYFPDQWKVVKVSVIGMQNKKAYDTLQSFRPISLGCNLSKVLEKIILGRLNWLARSGEWFSQDLHGFRAGRSTETAGHSLVSFVENGFSKKSYSTAVFLDIRSAFDSAWHPAIISALLKRSCPLYLIHLINSFLSNRKAILVHGSTTFEKEVKTGCPQGGVLSPFLWNVMVDDLLRIKFPFLCKLIAYADDLTVITQHLDPAVAVLNLQTACNTISRWLDEAKLSLNAVKSVLVIFHRLRTPLPFIQLVVNGVSILPSQTVTFLGFFLDAQLSWINHVAQKCTAAKRAIFAISNCLRRSWGYDRERLLFLYNSVVEPILFYGVSVWVGAFLSKRVINKIRSFQRSITLLATRAFKTAPTNSLLLLTKLLPADLRAVEIAAARMLNPVHEECFAPSSRRQINKVLPLLDDSQRVEQITMPHLTSHPPWDICFSVLSVTDGGLVSLCPMGPNAYRIYLAGRKCDGKVGFAVVVCNESSIIETSHGPLSQDYSAQRALNVALNWALKLALNSDSGLIPVNSQLEFFIAGQSNLFLTRPGFRLNPLELENFSFLVSIQTRSTIFLGLSN